MPASNRAVQRSAVRHAILRFVAPLVGLSAAAAVAYTPPRAPTSYQPRVIATTGQHVLAGPTAVSAADTFTVRNDGTAPATYSVVPLCDATTTLSDCWVAGGSVTLAAGASQRVIVYYTRAGTLDHPDTLRLVAAYVSAPDTYADTGRKVVIANSTYTPYVGRVSALTVPANGRRSWTASVANKGNAPANYTLAVACSGALTSCALPNSSTTMVIGLQPSQWYYPIVSFNTGAAGTSGQLRLIMTAPPRPSDGVVQADTSTVTFNAADVAAPTVSFEPFGNGIVGAGYHLMPADTATIYVNVCDSDGTVGTPTFKVSGTAFAAVSSTSSSSSACYTARRLAYKPVFLDGYGDITVTVSDGYHTAWYQTSYQHDGSPENAPRITAVHPTISVPINTASADTFVVANLGHQTLTYSLWTNCSQNPYWLTCGMSSSYSSVTLAAGASIRVPVSYSVAGVGSSMSVQLNGDYDGSFDTTSTQASFVVMAVGTLGPTISVSPTNGTTVTTSPIGQLRVDWCDPDDGLTRHDVVWQGQALPDTYVAATRSGCYAAGTSTYNSLAINPWQQSLVATATDVAGHTVTSTSTITFAPPLTNFAPDVTPTPDWHLLPGSGAATAADTFTVRNAGSYTTSYTLAALCGSSSTLSACATDKGSVSLAPGTSGQVIVTYTRSGATDLADTLRLVATYTSPIGGVIADTGRKVVMAPSVESAPLVKGTKSSFTVAPNVVTATSWFSLQNTGTAPTRYRLEFATTGGFSIRSAPDTVTVQPGQVAVPAPSILTPNSTGVSGTLTLTASYVTTSGQTLSATATVALTTSTSSGGTATIAVVGASAPLLTPNSASSIAFTVTNLSSSVSVVSYARVCAGAAIAVCGSLTRQIDSLAANQSKVVSVNITAGSSFGQAGTVTLTATSSSATGSAAVALAVGIVNGPLAMTPVSLLNPGTSIARDQCLTIAAGDMGAYECGDLRLVHALPTTTTLNTARAPALIYTSAHARPVTLVATDVAVDGSICPTQLTATVRFTASDTAQRSFAWNGPCGQRTTRRLVVPVDAVAHSHATGVYHYTLEIRATVNGTVYSIADPSGVMVVVNRSASAFGSGWWVDGVEQLVTIPDRTDQLLWIGGDGSTRVYTQQPGTSTFLVQPTVDRPDTLERLAGGAGYRRHLRNGAYVEFDSYLRHSSTVNAAGHSTRFYWTATQLDSISLPIADSSNGLARRKYQFVYRFGSLNNVVSPGVGGARYTTVWRTVLVNGADVSITDPLQMAVHYVSDSTGRIVVRTNRMGDGTRYDYDRATGVLLRVATDLTRTSGSTDSIRTSFCPAEASSLVACGAALADPSNVRTLVDGPRSDVADTAAFYLTAYGAPRRIVDALGNSTSVERTDARWPLLATAVVQANGHRVEATYTERGLTDATRDVDPFGRAADEVARTQYQWNAKFDKVDQVTAPTGEITRFGYFANGDRQWQEDGRGPVSRTWFAYNDWRQLASIQIPGNSSSQLQRMEYDPASGNLVREITPLGDTTFYHSDYVGRVDSVASPVKDAQRRSDKYVFDAADRVIMHRAYGPQVANLRSVTPEVALVDTTIYDAEGRPISVVRRPEPNFAITGFPETDWTYDAAGRRLTEVRVGGSHQAWTYDAAGNQITWTTGRYTGGAPVVVGTTYDALNRPTRRTMPQITVPAARGQSRFSCQHAPRFPYFSYLSSGSTYDPTGESGCDGTTPLPQPLILPADVADFTYDELGNIKTANNNDARVARAYYPNGALKTETQAIAIFDDLTALDARFNTHRYRLDYAYDLSGRRIARTDSIPDCAGCVQSYEYDPTSGLLAAMGDVGAAHNPAQFGFQYDGAGRLNGWSVNGTTAHTDLTYDANGRLAARTVVGAGTLIYQDDITYDRGGRITSASVGSQFLEIAGTTTSAYNGLGALAYFAQDRNGVALEDEFLTDGLGNRISDKRWVDGRYTTHNYRYTRDLLDQVNQATPWQGSAPPPLLQKADTTMTSYGGTGAVEYQYQAGIQFNTSTNRWVPDTLSDVWTWHAYGADERLRVSQRSIDDPDTRTRTAFSDYRYDALGRRVAARTRWDPYCQRAQPECLSVIERTIWDGDQVLMELRSPVGSEQEYAWGNYMGSVKYTHGAGVDEPLAVWKIEVGGVVPHRSWRGTYEAGTPIDQSSGNVTWPALTQDVFHAPDARLDPIQQSNWMGSIVEGKTDPSGLQYMRNRYYDPKSGRFTQEDPIGLGGGMNLYGFGGGDPVNYADPFGLCKDTKGNSVSPIDCDKPIEKVTGDIDIAQAILWISDIKAASNLIVGGFRRLSVAYLRRKAVAQAWTMEAQLIRRTGQGTRAWTEGETTELLESGRVKGYQGHHINSVNGYPELAGNPDNVRFVREGAEHLDQHSGNYRNKTTGDLLKRIP